MFLSSLSRKDRGQIMAPTVKSTKVPRFEAQMVIFLRLWPSFKFDFKASNAKRMLSIIYDVSIQPDIYTRL